MKNCFWVYTGQAPSALTGAEQKLFKKIASNPDKFLWARYWHPSLVHSRSLVPVNLSVADMRSQRYIYNRVFLRLISHNSGFLRHEQQIYHSHDDFASSVATMQVGQPSQPTPNGRPLFHDAAGIKSYYIYGGVYGCGMQREYADSLKAWVQAGKDAAGSWPGGDGMRPSFTSAFKHVRDNYHNVGPLLAMLIAGKRMPHLTTYVDSTC